MAKLKAIAIVVVGLALMPSASQAYSDRANSPNGRLAATIVTIGPGDENGTGSQALVLSDRASGRERRLLTSRYNEDYHQNLANLSNPLFSLDGGYVYVTSTDTSPNSPAVHQVNLRDGSVRFVANGGAIEVIRTGPYRGYLLVQAHRYYNRPQGGSYNPVFVMRPDGHNEFMVPGSDNDDGELAIAPWLARHGWHAW